VPLVQYQLCGRQHEGRDQAQVHWSLSQAAPGRHYKGELVTFRRSNDLQLTCRQCLASVRKQKHGYLTVTSNTYIGFKSTHCMVTRGKTTSAARNAVFNTLELVEHILGFLTVPELIKARGANRYINAIITSFPTLGRKVFLLSAVVSQVLNSNSR